jgi:translation elongation factor EF-1beta
MAKVATIYKVYAENTDKVASDIKAKLSPKSLQAEEIAFGIKVIKVMFVHEDSEGSIVYEEKLRAIPGVSEVEVAEESLL